jgi:Domain of unknown function (DUF1992)
MADDDPEPVRNQYVESMVEKQIREGHERGEFSGLPGFGKPLPSIDRPYSEMWWVQEFVKREKISILPPTLALRKQAEEAYASALQARSERIVREIITEINIRITEAKNTPLEGPPLNLVPFRLEDIVSEWREKHPELRPQQPSTTHTEISPKQTERKGRLLASIWRRFKPGA